MAKSAEELLLDLDPEQRAVATTFGTPVVVRAGAGTGKTRGITYRIAYGVLTGKYQENRLMALTFTKKAAEELQQRLFRLGVQATAVGTFHAAALAQLRHYWPILTDNYAPKVLDSKGRLLAEAAANLKMPRIDSVTLRDAAAEIEWRKVNNLTIERFAELSRPTPEGMSKDALVGLMHKYEELKDEIFRIDYEDILLVLAGMLETEPLVIEQVRRQYRSFVVDEYQDVSPLQQRLLDLWLGNRNDIVAVGDAAQTIYSFAGASSDYLLGFAHKYPGAVELRLETNYRSTPEILRLANHIVSHEPGALELVAAPQVAAPEVAAPEVATIQQGDKATQQVDTASKHSDIATQQLDKATTDFPPDVTTDETTDFPPDVTTDATPESAAPLRVTEDRYSDDQAEAQALAKKIAALVNNGTSAANISVLFRINSQSALIEQALSQHGVRYQVHGAKPFFERTEIREAVMLLRGAAYSSGTELAVHQTETILRSMTWSRESPVHGGAKQEWWKSLEQLDELAQARPEATLREFVDRLQGMQQAKQAPTQQSVTLASIHSAKGMEWDHVFVIGLAEGILPISMATTAQMRQEERRLLYVAVTRARAGLYLSWAEAGRGGRNRQRSSLLP